MALYFPPDEYAKSAAANVAKIFNAVEAAAAKAGVACATQHVKDRYAAEGIVDAAKERGCDLIVMASHGRRGLTRLLIGSQTNRVVTHSTIPVLICR